MPNNQETLAEQKKKELIRLVKFAERMKKEQAKKDEAEIQSEAQVKRALTKEKYIKDAIDKYEERRKKQKVWKMKMKTPNGKI